MSVLHSLRVVGAMAGVTARIARDAAFGHLHRASVDEETRWFGRRVVELLGIDLVVRGQDRVPPNQAYVYMSNHQSHLDIPVLYACLPSPTIRMLAKRELFDIPVWGWGLRQAEFVEVDRHSHTKAVASIGAAARLITSGVSIYLAPEGTRSKDGRIGPLKKGGFHLALDTGAPIVPVALSGTGAILPPGAKAMRTGCRVEVEIGAPIAVAGRTVDELRAEVAAFLAAHVAAP